MRQFLSDLALSSVIMGIVGWLPCILGRDGAAHPLPGGGWIETGICAFWALFGAVAVCPEAREYVRRR